MKQQMTIVFFIFGFIATGDAQRNYLITGTSAGNVRLGMTVAQIRKSMRGFKLSRTSDGEGIALIEVS